MSNLWWKKKKRYAPSHVSEGSQWVVQDLGRQGEEHHCIGELRNGHASIDQEQGEELQRPRQEGHAPLLHEGPVLVTNSKAETPNYQDVACKSRRM